MPSPDSAILFSPAFSEAASEPAFSVTPIAKEETLLANNGQLVTIIDDQEFEYEAIEGGLQTVPPTPNVLLVTEKSMQPKSLIKKFFCCCESVSEEERPLSVTTPMNYNRAMRG